MGGLEIYWRGVALTNFFWWKWGKNLEMVVCYLIMPIWGGLETYRRWVPLTNLCWWKLGKNYLGGGGIISSMHRLRMVVCYLIMSLGMALKPIEWESVTNYCLWKWEQLRFYLYRRSRPYIYHWSHFFLDQRAILNGSPFSESYFLYMTFLTLKFLYIGIFCFRLQVCYCHNWDVKWNISHRYGTWERYFMKSTTYLGTEILSHYMVSIHPYFKKTLY